MATYYETYGQKVQYLASDPASPQNGQVWFNSTSNLLKVGVTQQGAWATGGNLSNARGALGGAGTQTSALAFGGTLPGSSAATEEWTGPQTTATASTLTTS